MYRADTTGRTFESLVNSDRYQTAHGIGQTVWSLRALLIQIGIKHEFTSLVGIGGLRALLIQIGIKLQHKELH